MTRRAPGRKGLPYLDANRGRLIQVDNDVLGYKRLIEHTYPELEVFYDETDHEWVVVEHCKDGVDRHVLSTKVLGEHILIRLARADESNPDKQDFLEEIDEHNAGIEKERASRFADQMGDFAQRFAHALRKDGYFDHEDVFGTRNHFRGSNRPVNRT